MYWAKVPDAPGFGNRSDPRGGDLKFGDEVVGCVRPMSKARDPYWFWLVPPNEAGVPDFNWLTDNNPVFTRQEACDALATYVKSHLFKS